MAHEHHRHRHRQRRRRALPAGRRRPSGGRIRGAGSIRSAPGSNATCAPLAPTRGNTSRRARRATSSAITATGPACPSIGTSCSTPTRRGLPRSSWARTTARFFHEHVLVKEPRTESRTPWHHDLPYYCIDGTQCVSFWTALDPVPRAICLELVVGSHRWGKSFMPRKFIGVGLPARGRGPRYHAGHRRASGRIRDRVLRRGAGRRHRLPLPHRPRRARQRLGIGAAPRLRSPLGRRRRPLQGAPRGRFRRPSPRFTGG